MRKQITALLLISLAVSLTAASVSAGSPCEKLKTTQDNEKVTEKTAPVIININEPEKNPCYHFDCNLNCILTNCRACAKYIYDEDWIGLYNCVQDHPKCKKCCHLIQGA